ncbi:MAG: hypothetical protein QXU32_01700 [Nitrososphaerales archaeon]
MQYFALASVINYQKKLDDEREVLRWKMLISILFPRMRHILQLDDQPLSTSIPDDYVPIQNQPLLREKIIDDLINLGVAVIDEPVSDQ